MSELCLVYKTLRFRNIRSLARRNILHVKRGLVAREKLGFIDNGWFLRQNKDQSGKHSKVKPALDTYRHTFGIYSISRPLIDNRPILRPNKHRLYLIVSSQV